MKYLTLAEFREQTKDADPDSIIMMDDEAWGAVECEQVVIQTQGATFLEDEPYRPPKLLSRNKMGGYSDGKLREWVTFPTVLVK